MSNTQQLGTLNFLVPATGETNVTAITLPNSDIGSTDPYSIDWLSLNSFIQGQLFIPQACTIIAVDLASSVTIDFEIKAIGFKRTILGGTSPTFQFPALQNLVTSVTPSDGTSSFVTQWYNYPALPDAGETAGTVSGSVAVTSLPVIEPAPITPQAGAASEIVTGGTAVVLVAGPCNGGYITNPPDAASQGIAAVENAYIDPVAAPGDTQALGNGTTSILAPGQNYTIPALATGASLYGNAATSGHKLTVVVY